MAVIALFGWLGGCTGGLYTLPDPALEPNLLEKKSGYRGILVYSPTTPDPDKAALID